MNRPDCSPAYGSGPEPSDEDLRRERRRDELTVLHEAAIRRSSADIREALDEVSDGALLMAASRVACDPEYLLVLLNERIAKLAESRAREQESDERDTGPGIRPRWWV